MDPEYQRIEAGRRRRSFGSAVGVGRLRPGRCGGVRSGITPISQGVSGYSVRIRARAPIIERMNKPTDRLTGPRGPVPASPPAGAIASRWIGRVLGIVVGTAIAIGALFVSVVAFSVVLVVGVVVGGWLWWRTREVRRRFREEVAKMQQALDGANGPPGARGGMGGADARGADPFGQRAGRGRPPGSGDVLDGDFIREASDRARRGDDGERDRPAG